MNCLPLPPGCPGSITAPYFYGLMTLPWLCWSGGTLLGASASRILPAAVLSALGVAIYGMFIAILVPAARRSGAVAAVVAVAVALSCCFSWIPLFRRVSGGFAIILCAVAAAAVGALIRPVEDA